MGGSQSQHRDGDGSAGHVDGGTQGDGDGILLFIQTQILAQGHVHRDVGSGGAGEEGHDATDLQALEDQRIGVLADAEEHDDGVHHQGNEEHTAHQHRDDVDIGLEDGNTGGGNSAEHQTADTKGCAVDDPADGHRQGIRQICQNGLGSLGGLTQGKAEDHSPHQNTNVIGVDQGSNGVGNGVHEEVLEHLTDTAGSGHALRAGLQDQGGGECKAGNHGSECGSKGTRQVQHHNGGHVGLAALLLMSQSVHDNEEHQQGSQSLQRADKQIAQNGDHGHTGDDHAQNGADHQTHEDPLHKRDLVPFTNEFQCISSFHFSFLFTLKKCVPDYHTHFCPSWEDFLQKIFQFFCFFLFS